MVKILDIDSGMLLVAADIHGNWVDYQKIQNLFMVMRNEGKADKLVFLGDLIHAYEGEDSSLKILEHLVSNADPDVIALLGNHELMHIYHLNVSKNGQKLAEKLEEEIERIEKDREVYVRFMKQMPYAIRTKGGVILAHTGPNPPMTGVGINPIYAALVMPDQPSKDKDTQNRVYTTTPEKAFNFIVNLDHDKLLEGLKQMTKKVIEAGYKNHLAEDFFDDYSPQLGEMCLHTNIGMYLWDIFFKNNEQEFDERFYSMMQERYLETMSAGGRPQKLIVTGHMTEPLGFKVVGNNQIRMCSSYGASDEKKTLLIVDSAKEYLGFEKLGESLFKLNS